MALLTALDATVFSWLTLYNYRYANKIMVSDELPDGQMVDQWEPIGPDSVQTPLEV